MSLKAAFFLILFLLTPNLVSGHGPVTMQQQIVGDYKIEFEYDTQSIYAGRYVIYGAHLLDKNGDIVDYDAAFIRIEKSDGTAVMAANLAPYTTPKGYTSLSATLYDLGLYKANLSFYNDEKRLAVGEFNFEVMASPIFSIPKITWILLIVVFILGLTIGIVGVLLSKVPKQHG